MRKRGDQKPRCLPSMVPQPPWSTDLEDNSKACNVTYIIETSSAWRPPGPYPSQYQNVKPSKVRKVKKLPNNMRWSILCVIFMFWPYMSFGFPTNEGELPKQTEPIEPSRDEATTLREGRELGMWQMSTARLARSTTPASIPKPATDIPMPQHFPKASFLVPFGRKLTKESPNAQRKPATAATVDHVKTSNVRKRNFNTAPSSVIADRIIRLTELNDLLSDSKQLSSKPVSSERKSANLAGQNDKPVWKLANLAGQNDKPVWKPASLAGHSDKPERKLTNLAGHSDKPVWKDNTKEKERSRNTVIRFISTVSSVSPKPSMIAIRSSPGINEQGGRKGLIGIRKEQALGSAQELFGRRETGLRRGLPKLPIDQVRGRDKIARGRVRIKGALLRQIQARREKEEQKTPRKNDQLVAARPSRLRIRNINLRRNVTTTIKSFSPKSFPSEVMETSSPKTLSFTSGYSVTTNEIKGTNSSDIPDIISITTMRSNPPTTANQVAEKINQKSVNGITTTTEDSDMGKLEITSLKALVKEYQNIRRPSIPTTDVLLQQLKSTTMEKLLVMTNKHRPTITTAVLLVRATTTQVTSTTISTKSTATTTTTTTTTSKTTATTATTTTITTRIITSTTSTTISSTKTITTVPTTTVSAKSEKQPISISSYPTLKLKLLSSSKFSKNQSSEKILSSTNVPDKLLHLSLITKNHQISPLESVRPRAELKKDLLEAIRRKISKNKLVQAQRESKIEILNQTEGLKSANLQALHISNGANFASSNSVSSTKPPFFRPISFPLHRGNSSEGRNDSLPKVKIFVNLPNTKPGSIVKIPNVSHIQDKLARLNAAITEGLKIQRKKQEHEAREKEIAQQVEKLNSDKLQKIIHPTKVTTTTTKKTTTTAKPSTIKTVAPITIPFKTKVTTEKFIDKIITVNYFEKLRKEQENLATEIHLNRIKHNQSIKISTTTQLSTAIISTASTRVTKTTYKPKKPRKIHPSYGDHPSSHFRPKNNSQLYPMPKSTMGHTPVFIVTPKYGTYRPRIRNSTASNMAGTEKKVDKEADSRVIEDITGTTVYVVGIIAIIPAAGILAWLVRFIIRRKELSSSESSSETGLNRSITEEDSLQISGRHSQVLAGPCFETIAEAPENIPKVDNLDVGNSLWEFPRSRLRLQTILGEGNFGKVWKAEADDICGYDGTILVAVKTVKENSSQREVEDLIQEMKIMQEIGPHANVVTILGVCSEQEPHLLIMEYVMYGKLLTHLREQRSRQSSFFNFSKDGAEIGETLTSKDLTKFAYGVAKGMEFLVTKGVIHRDLAARNILVDHNKNTKISDFGLSRNLRDLGGEMYEQKTKGALPIRWMAPESLYFSVFTPKSDVWGFGILMWEIVTLGSTPYPGMGAREVMRRVRDGYRLERPAHCHPELYLIIQKCWAGDMNKRPDFSELRKELAKLLEDQHGYIDLQNIPENKYYSMDQNPDEEEKL